MKQTLHLNTPLLRAHSGRIAPRQASVLDVCAALFYTLAGLLGFEGAEDGE